MTQAAERGVAAAVIDAVFKAFEPFERYGFNKAHATCYGLIAYQTAYLKANYTVEYMASVLTAFRDSTERVAGGHRRVPPPGHRGAAAGRARQRSRLHGRGRRHPLRPAGDQERRPGRHRVDRRGPRGGRRIPLAGRLLRAGRPAPGQQAGARVAGQGRRAQPRSAIRRSCCSPSTTRIAVRPGGAARPGRRPGVAVRRLGADGGPLERPLPDATEAPSRERLRWEKELLGLYLSDHPLGELAGEMGRYVNAYIGDMGEELDQQRIVRRRRRHGPADGHHQDASRPWAWPPSRTSRARSRSSSSPRCSRRPAGIWAEDADPARRRAGRPQGRGDRAAGRLRLDLGAGAGARAGRLRTRRSRPASGDGEGRDRLATATASGAPTATATGPGTGTANGHRNGSRQRVCPVDSLPRRWPCPPSPRRRGTEWSCRCGPSRSPCLWRTWCAPCPLVSPLRGGAVTGSIDVWCVRAGSARSRRAPTPMPPQPRAPEPVGELPGPPSLDGLAPDGGDEPPWPEEARAGVSRGVAASTPQVSAAPDQVLHVRFGRAPQDRVAAAFGDPS